ncbi:MAG: AmmeMemoRadiSam system protein B [Phycisphaerae bacterium]|jgi:hypothetical protein
MMLRSPAVAGLFYPASAKQCRLQIEQCLAEARTAGTPPPPGFQATGGIAPHAGWMFSGAVAGQVVELLARDPTVETFVVFGAVHRRMGPAAAVYGRGGWNEPLGDILIDEELAAACTERSNLIVEDPEAHRAEHSIEVEVPFIQYAAPKARLLPIMVPPSPAAPRVGAAVAEAAARLGRQVRFLGSTDLTHYGPRYGFLPRGSGAEGLAWARDVNDRRMIELMVNLKADEVVVEAARSRNACGAGAIAAVIAACRTAGADRGHLLRHTNSSEVCPGRGGEMEDAVGYAGVVFGRIG